MKTLKYILYGIISIVLILLVLAYFAPSKTEYQKKININAPKEKVWQLINSMEAMDKWSPWNKKDPSMQKTFSGQSGTPGSSMCWKSKIDDVGSGCQTIKSIEQNNIVNTQINFKEPFESEADAYVSLKSLNTNQTEVTWGFVNISPYPFRIMNLFMDIGKMLEPDYTEGLNNLKALAEQ